MSDIAKQRLIFFGQKIPFRNFIFRNYLYLFMLIYINQLIQKLNLLSTFVSTARLDNNSLINS